MSNTTAQARSTKKDVMLVWYPGCAGKAIWINFPTAIKRLAYAHYANGAEHIRVRFQGLIYDLNLLPDSEYESVHLDDQVYEGSAWETLDMFGDTHEVVQQHPLEVKEVDKLVQGEKLI